MAIIFEVTDLLNMMGMVLECNKNPHREGGNIKSAVIRKQYGCEVFYDFEEYLKERYVEDEEELVQYFFQELVKNVFKKES